ncbi:MAG: peptidylprolyl isomerase [Pseudomonadota bacterium]
MSDKASVIAPGSRVVMHYRLAMEDGNVVDSTWDDDEPIEFTVGDGTMAAGLDDALQGLKIDDHVTIHLTADQAFGEKDTANIHSMPREEFDSKMPLEPGMVIGFTLPNGEELPGMVLEADETSVLVDFNHPLSGHTIMFEVMIISIENISAANDEE